MSRFLQMRLFLRTSQPLRRLGRAIRPKSSLRSVEILESQTQIGNLTENNEEGLPDLSPTLITRIAMALASSNNNTTDQFQRCFELYQEAKDTDTPLSSEHYVKLLEMFTAPCTYKPHTSHDQRIEASVQIAKHPALLIFNDFMSSGLTIPPVAFSHISRVSFFF